MPPFLGSWGRTYRLDIIMCINQNSLLVLVVPKSTKDYRRKFYRLSVKLLWTQWDKFGGYSYSLEFTLNKMAHFVDMLAIGSITRYTLWNIRSIKRCDTKEYDMPWNRDSVG